MDPLWLAWRPEMAVRLGRTWSKLDADGEEKGKEKDLLCFVLASKVQ